MKSLHFCTKELLEQIYTGSGNIVTFRTGWIPHVFVGDIVNLLDNNKNGKLITTGEVFSVTPVYYHTIPDKFIKSEIYRYKRKFHPEQYFFRIIIKILKYQNT